MRSNGPISITALIASGDESGGNVLEPESFGRKWEGLLVEMLKRWPVLFIVIYPSALVIVSASRGVKPNVTGARFSD
jgi:hypothetical protein